MCWNDSTLELVEMMREEGEELLSDQMTKIEIFRVTMMARGAVEWPIDLARELDLQSVMLDAAVFVVVGYYMVGEEVDHSLLLSTSHGEM